MTYAFAGNRGFVYWRMREMGLDVPHVFAVEGSYLQRELVARGVSHHVLSGKAEFVSTLESLDFDVLVSNGCPIILPISHLEEATGARFVNIHPSLLPKLRGADPVPGAILFGEDSGATCHVMGDGIDTGPIISQVRIPMTDDLDAGLLYQLSFQAEVEAFEAACARDFQPDPSLQPSPDEPGSYYTFRPEDLELDFSASDEALIRKIKAFATRSKGAWFSHNGARLRVLGVEEVGNPYVYQAMPSYALNQIVLRYEDTIIVRRMTTYLRFRLAAPVEDSVQQGDRLA
jgi:methionyl-tRNA formyltransferase